MNIAAAVFLFIIALMHVLGAICFSHRIKEVSTDLGPLTSDDKRVAFFIFMYLMAMTVGFSWLAYSFAVAV